jgi:hypothetical protein
MLVQSALLTREVDLQGVAFIFWQSLGQQALVAVKMKTAKGTPMASCFISIGVSAQRSMNLVHSDTFSPLILTLTIEAHHCVVVIMSQLETPRRG